MKDVKYYAYPMKALLRPITAFAVIIILIAAAVIRLSVSGQNDLAFKVLCVAAFFLIIPSGMLALVWSSIGVSDEGIYAKAFGLVWKRIEWSDVHVIQKLIVQVDKRDSAGTTCRILIGRQYSKNFRIAFSSQIGEYEELVSRLNRVCKANDIKI